MADEHNPRLMGCAGHPTVLTPHLDALAAQGTRFSNAYAAAPTCAPARQSVLTGLWPQEHGQYSNVHVLHPDTRTLAHDFTEAGYVTGAIGKLHTNNEGELFGFTERRPCPAQGDIRVAITGDRAALRPRTDGDRAEADAFAAIPDPKLWGAPLDDPRLHPDLRVLQRSLEFMKKNRRRPFFLLASFFEPHFPWLLPREAYYRYDPAALPPLPIDPDDLDDSPWALKLLLDRGWFAMDDAQHRLCRARYYAAVSWVDELVGAVVAGLDALRLTERTLVLYLSDHGDMASEKGLWRKNVMFDGAARVPLIARLPGVLPAGAVLDAPVNHTDLLPTALSFAGLQPAGRVNGRDLSPWLRGEAPPPEDTWSMELPEVGLDHPRILMMRNDRWKFVRYRRRYGGPDRYVELYDMKADPLESRNLAYDADQSERVQRLWEKGDFFLGTLRSPVHPVLSVRHVDEDEAPDD